MRLGSHRKQHVTWDPTYRQCGADSYSNNWDLQAPTIKSFNDVCCSLESNLGTYDNQSRMFVRTRSCRSCSLVRRGQNLVSAMVMSYEDPEMAREERATKEAEQEAKMAKREARKVAFATPDRRGHLGQERTWQQAVDYCAHHERRRAN